MKLVELKYYLDNHRQRTGTFILYGDSEKLKATKNWGDTESYCFVTPLPLATGRICIPWSISKDGKLIDKTGTEWSDYGISEMPYGKTDEEFNAIYKRLTFRGNDEMIESVASRFGKETAEVHLADLYIDFKERPIKPDELVHYALKKYTEHCDTIWKNHTSEKTPTVIHETEAKMAYSWLMNNPFKSGRLEH